MTETQYLNFCEKYLKGLCSPEEENMLDAYQKENGLFDLNLSGDEVRRLRETLSSRLTQSMQAQHGKKFNVVWLNWKIIAPIAAVLLVTIYLAVHQFSSYKQKPVLTAKVKPLNEVKDIIAGSANAVLTLSTGESIKLDGSKNGLINTGNSTSISKSGNGLVVSALGKDSPANNELLNKITIPRGGKYNITLPDGTRVWLNSSSSLSFPNTFEGPDRKVMLTGEAYFEVASNKQKPFKVNVAGKQEVEVLGTHFNISAFEEDQNITTTLLEGAVKVNTSKFQTLIKPGEMAVNNLKTKPRIVQADLDEVMAWKNDMFIFNNENITSIMKKISRWYDVDVTYEGDMTTLNFEGNYSRSKGLKSLLKNISLTDKVRFVMAERRITVIAK
ncbi:FecR family protein [Pedobacter sp. CFBP9032]|uniref:FecR family protein n=1 Tax=Pedobacter sp. CFBP9032 TaxID=3096539 RepID=UPI002A698933|nr:FecR domain-containing protein [Pedobacter sp. CFBP9032]MDY0906398.1 FecR domain-containing protein [Pedobacter sp. CFBP9032]